MVDQIIRPANLPRRSNPVASEIVPVDNSVEVAGATIQEMVEAGRPTANQSEAEAGVNPSKSMAPLNVKQAIDFQVPAKIDAAIGALNLGTAAQRNADEFATAAQGDKADTAVQPARTITAGTGLTGGGSLAADRTISLDIASQADAEGGVVNNKAVSPLRARQLISVRIPDPQDAGMVANDPSAASDNFLRMREFLAVRDYMHMQPGIYYIRPERINDSDFTKAIALNEGAVIAGYGVKLILSPDQWQSQSNPTDFYYAFAMRSGSRIEGIFIDGARQSILPGSATSVGMRAIQTFVGAEDIKIRNVDIVNIPAIGNIESFGINTSPGAKRAVLENVNYRNIDGTGCHIRGDYHPTSVNGPVVDSIVRGGSSIGNTWHGYSFYGALNVSVEDTQALNNTRIGYNSEFALGVSLEGYRAEGNGQAGFRSLGDGSGMLGRGVVRANCVIENAGNGELTFRPGTWELGGTPIRKVSSGWKISQDAIIQPSPTTAHVYVRQDDTVTEGLPVHERLEFQCETEGWRFSLQNVDSSSASTPKRIGANYYFSKNPPLSSIYMPPAQLWATSNVSIAPFSGSGSSSGSVLLTSSASNANIRSPRKVLRRGQSYRITLRFQPQDDSEWFLLAQDWASVLLGSTYTLKNMRLRAGTKSVGQWLVGQLEVSIPPDRDANVQIQQSSSGTNSIVIDWIRVERIGAESNSFVYMAGNKRDTGTVEPVSGSWDSGDGRDNITPTSGGPSSWECIAGGTFGALSGVSATTTSGSPSITVNDSSGLIIGNYIVISGSSGIRQVIDINGNTVRMDGNASATLSGAAVSFSPPSFRSIVLST